MRSKQKRTIVVSLLMLFVCVAKASERMKKPFSFLQNEYITSMTNDSYGRAWIGTTKGIFVYDGTTLYKYGRSRKYSSHVLSLITHIAITKNRQLIGFAQNGLYIYDKQRDEFMERECHVNITNFVDVLPNGNIIAIDGSKRRAVVLDPRMTRVIKSTKINISKGILSFRCLADGNYIAYQGCDYCIFSPALKVIKQGKISSQIWGVTEAFGRIVLYTDRGVVALSRHGTTVSIPGHLASILKDKDILFMHNYRNKLLYIGIAGYGICEYNLDTEAMRLITKTIDGSPLTKDWILLCMDSGRRLWLKNRYGNYLGCNIINTTHTYLNFDVVLDMTFHPEMGKLLAYGFSPAADMYILTDRGMYRHYEKINTNEKVLDLAYEGNGGIAFDRRGRMYIVSSNCDITVYNLAGGRPVQIKQVHAGKHIYRNYALANHFITFAFADGILSFDDDLNVTYEATPSYKGMNYVYPEPGGHYVGICTGLTELGCYAPGRGFWNRKTYHDTPCDIRYKLVDSHHMIWTATDGRGVLVSNPKGKVVRTLSIATGLADNTVYCVAEDRKGNMWIATTNGLAEYIPSSKKLVDFGEVDNMIFDPWFGHLQKSPDGNVYISSSKYLLKINPSAKSLTPQVPLLLDVKVNNDRFFGLPEAIKVNHDENNLSISFVTVDMLCSGLISYEYYLDGYDNDWHTTSSGTAIYNNVPPGRYTLRVRACYADGNYSAERRLPVTIIPAFYQTLMFKGLVLMLLVLAIAYGVRFIIRTRVSVAEYKFNADKERMKVDLYTNLSHLIRTPVSLINAPFKELVDEHLWNQKEQGLIDVINKNISHIMDLTQQFLESWSGNETGDPMDKTLRLKDKDITAIIRETALVFRPTATQKGIALSLDTPESLIIKTDEDKIVKILYNLVSNAIKHTPRGGRVKIEARMDGKNLQLAVADTGEGVSDNIKKKIFDRFFKATTSITSSESFGIGLYHSHQLVRLLGGTLTVRDNKPHGAVFTIVVPVERRKEAVGGTDGNENSETVSETEAVTGKDGSGRVHLLIVEDNEDMRNYLATSLEETYDVTIAGDGIEAMAVFDKENIDIVITDVMMPRMDGYALCRWIKENPLYCHIPVVILTAKSKKTDELEGWGCGAEAYLRKPFEMQFLKTVLTNILDNRRKVQQAMMRLMNNTEKKEPETKEADVMMNAKDKAFIDKLYSLMEENLDNDKYGLQQIWQDMGFSKTNFYKKVNALTGSTPNQLFSDFKMTKVKKLMQTGEYTISEIAYKTGFSSIATFSRKFHAVYGMSPTEYMKQKGVKA